jgi:uncharacterized membrane protein
VTKKNGHCKVTTPSEFHYFFRIIRCDFASLFAITSFSSFWRDWLENITELFELTALKSVSMSLVSFKLLFVFFSAMLKLVISKNQQDKKSPILIGEFPRSFVVPISSEFLLSDDTIRVSKYFLLVIIRYWLLTLFCGWFFSTF